MYTGADGRSVDRRVFRRHWLIKLALPGSPWLMVITLLSFAVLHLLPYSRYAPGLFVLAAFPLIRLFQLYLAWLGYSVSATVGSNVIVERSGFLNVSENLIPLTRFGTVAYERPWWAFLFRIDIGDAIVGAMGGPFTLRSMGNFSDLWTVLQSKGQIVPPQRPPALAVLLELLWRCVGGPAKVTLQGLSFPISWGRSVIKTMTRRFSNWVSSLVRHLRQPPHRPVSRAAFGFTVNMQSEPSSMKVRRFVPTDPCHSVPDGDYIYKGESFSPVTLSQAGFWAFCEQFVLMDKNWTRWRYRTRDSSRLYYPGGISDHVARFYLRRLRQAYVLIPGPNGCSGERVSCRIHSIGDIQRLVPDFPGPLNKTA
jgi:hypothetical protein